MCAAPDDLNPTKRNALDHAILDALTEALAGAPTARAAWC
jgi:hypothetical protein